MSDQPPFEPSEPPRPLGYYAVARSADFPDELNPWLSIWFNPRATIHVIVDSFGERPTLAVAALAGVLSMFWRLLGTAASEFLDLPTILGLSVSFGVLMGILEIYIAGLLFYYPGTWLGGEASKEDLRAVAAWSAIPRICAMSLMLILFLSVRFDLIRFDVLKRVVGLRVSVAGWISFVQTSLMVLFIVGTLWSLIAFFNSLAQVQGFSFWKTLANCVLALVLVFGVILALTPLVLVVVMILQMVA